MLQASSSLPLTICPAFARLVEQGLSFRQRESPSGSATATARSADQLEWNIRKKASAGEPRLSSFRSDRRRPSMNHHQVRTAQNADGRLECAGRRCGLLFSLAPPFRRHKFSNLPAPVEPKKSPGARHLLASIDCDGVVHIHSASIHERRSTQPGPKSRQNFQAVEGGIILSDEFRMLGIVPFAITAGSYLALPPSGGKQTDGGPGQSRTADQRFRKPLLYPSELQGQSAVCSVYRRGLSDKDWFRCMVDNS